MKSLIKKRSRRSAFKQGPALTRNSKPGTRNRQSGRRALLRVFRSLVFGLAHTFLDSRIGDGEDCNGDQSNDAWEHQPFRPISSGGNPQIILGDLTKRQPKYQGWPRPPPLKHEIANGAENESNNDVGQVVIGCERANEHEEQKEGNQQRAADKRQRG